MDWSLAASKARPSNRCVRQSQREYRHFYVTDFAYVIYFQLVHHTRSFMVLVILKNRAISAAGPSTWIAAAWPSPTMQKGMAQVSKDLHETLARPEDGSMLHIVLGPVSVHPFL